MAKATAVRNIRDDHQKAFLKIFNSLCGRFNRWQVWQDFVMVTAIEISNATDKQNAPERTKTYQTIISKYSDAEQNKFAELLAEITFDPKLHPDMEGFISVSDPACGAGATLLAFLNVCKRRNICYHNKVLVIAQDIDFIVGLMCYIQCSFMGCAGYVVIGDTLTDPATAYDSRGLLPAGPQNRIWYMPFLSTDMWYMRRQIAQMNLLLEPKGEPAKIEKADTKPADLQKSIKNEPKAPENEPLNETKTGQLTFF